MKLFAKLQSFRIIIAYAYPPKGGYALVRTVLKQSNLDEEQYKKCRQPFVGCRGFL